MKPELGKFVISIVLAHLLAVAGPAAAQHASLNAGSSTGSGSTRIDSKIAYHNGPVTNHNVNLYYLWYGCWATPGCGDANGQSNDASIWFILTDFASNLGGSPYFQINAGYPDSSGYGPTGQLIYGGAALDRYSRGPTLTAADLSGVIGDRILAGELPLDPNGVYVVLTSSDIALVDGATQFCLTCCNLHGVGTVLGSQILYAFVGNPARCPGSCASQFQGQASPNGNYAADAMASWLAHALSRLVTNPLGNAWYDRYGLENAEKCEGTYGETHTITNPNGDAAETNVQLGQRHWLLQQNWVNGKKGHCGMSPQ